MTPAIPDDLLELERAFWTGDSEFFVSHTDDSCLVAFPQMAQLMNRGELAATAGSGNRWRDLQMTVKGVIDPSPEIFIFSYEASAVRSTGERYSALVSTGYVKRVDGWKMMFHAQTPRSGSQF